ncbi:hypothetical protein KAR91_57305 [Candidatus Pacearchaeota archaeon]|nr:hypothetical protein [Candidatus Pacearchaeota archaeon]
MSADSWGKCPKCLKAAEDASIQRLTEAEESYGNVSSSKYVQLLEAARKPTEIDENFREDYEIYMTESGEFFVSYSGQCQECDAKFTFKHTVENAIAL